MRNENEPTDNQINYAHSLGIYVPCDITFSELSDLISNVENNDKPATERHKAFADFYGVKYTKNVGKKRLFNRIQSEIFSNNQENYMASWFVFRVYRSLVQGQEDVSILSPDNKIIKKISSILLQDPNFLNSLKRYSGSDLRYFGEFTDRQGITHFGASKTTNAYKLALAELKKYPNVQQDIERDRSLLINKKIYNSILYKESLSKDNQAAISSTLTVDQSLILGSSPIKKLQAKIETINEKICKKYKERRLRSMNKSKLISYILLIFFGFLGMHRFYLGRIVSGNAIGIIFILSLVFEIFRPLIFIPIILVLIDLFILPRMLKNSQREWF